MVRKMLFLIMIGTLFSSPLSVWGADMGEIESGETGTGYLRSSNSYQDSWTFYGAAGDRVVITSAGISGGVQPCIYLYPPDGNPQENSACGIEHSFTLDHQLLETGLYTIFIRDYNMDAQGDYGIALAIIPGAATSSTDPDGGPIASGQTLTGTLSHSADTDIFQFYGDAGDRVVITAAGISGGVQSCIYLYPPDSNPLENSACGIEHSFTLDHQLLETGLYTIIIRDYNMDTQGDYGIALAIIPGAATSSTDPDGGPIASGQTLTGTLSHSADTDIFQFYGDAGDRVVITAAGISGGVQSCIYLYPPDSNPLENSACGIEHSFTLDHQLLETGLYTIIIRDYNMDTQGDYGIALAIIPGAATSSTDPDGGPIASGQTLTGTLSHSADTDIFQFYGDAGDRVVITAAGISGGVQSCIYLYPPDSNPLENSACGIEHSFTLDHQLLETGLYTIIIRDYNMDTQGDYGIALAIIPGAATSSTDPDGGPIASGQTLTGTLSHSADTDIFQFYGDAGDRVVITAAGISGGVQSCIYLYPPDSNPLENSACGIEHSFTLDHQLLETGLYTIIIRDYNMDTQGDYGIALAIIPGAATSSTDPDGGPIASGQTLTGTLSHSADTDIFQFYGDAGDRVVITAAGISGGVQSCIYLYPPDSNPLENSACGIEHSFTLDHQLLETGLYTIIIRDYNMDTQGDYGIALAIIPGAATSSTDPDGGPIASGQTLTGTLSHSADTDIFQFYGDAGDRVVITAAGISGGVQSCIYLYPPDSNPLENSACGIEHSFTLDHQLLETGLYTIIIRDYNMDAQGDFNTSLSKIPPTLRPGIYNPEPSNICGVSLDPDLSWDAVSDATSYDVYFGTDVVEPLENVASNIPSIFYPLENLEIQTIYYWTVIAHTPSGDIPGTINWFGTQFKADLNADGHTDELDLDLFADDFGRTNCDVGDPCEGDYEPDNDVDGSDFAIFAADFGICR